MIRFEKLNNAPVRPLDRAHMKELPPGAQRFYEIHQNICGNFKYISLHRGCGTLDSIKRILKDMYDNYEPLAKKVYEVIKKHFVVIDI